MGQVNLTLAKGLMAALIVSSGHAEPPKVEHPTLVEAAHATKVATPEDYYRPLDNWLKAKGSPISGKDVYEVAVQYHLDWDFLLGVLKAETQLCTVKQRGSMYNCGSVGSWDSTDTTFQANSYRHGIELIAQTVNNQYLGAYTRVSELSRYGNKTGHVYATSPVSWNANVVGTMNELKGQNNTDYTFRK